MIEQPDIDNEKIKLVLNRGYSIQVKDMEFLPIGNDASAFAYRVETAGDIYFLKIRRGLTNPASLFVPRFLKDQGIEQVVAPLFTKAKRLFNEVDGFTLILYPFVAGNEAMKVGMSDAQWREFGSVLKRIHSMEIPQDISQYVRRETFIPKWGNLAKDLHLRILTKGFDGLYQKQLSVFWREKKETIQVLIERTEMIGRNLQQMDLGFLLCHADIHTANILIANEQNMFIVDWDDTLLAPKERDLMFVLEQDAIHTREEQFFFDGYGNVKIDPLVLAYYSYEWCVQEIGDYGQRVFLAKDAGASTKQDALEGFIELFSPGDVVEAALSTAFESAIRITYDGSL